MLSIYFKFKSIMLLLFLKWPIPSTWIVTEHKYGLNRLTKRSM